MGIHSEANLDVKLLALIKQINLYLNHFPSYEKYGLCLEIRRSVYSVYGYHIEAQKRYHKKTVFSNLDVAHEQLRMFVRLAHELDYFMFKNGRQEKLGAQALADKRFRTLSLRVDEVGRIIGGWINAERAKEKK